jgi:hypothetical protein
MNCNVSSAANYRLIQGRVHTAADDRKFAIQRRVPVRWPDPENIRDAERIGLSLIFCFFCIKAKEKTKHIILPKRRKADPNFSEWRYGFQAIEETNQAATTKMSVEEFIEGIR